jgi:hypothetical protein
MKRVEVPLWVVVALLGFLLFVSLTLNSWHHRLERVIDNLAGF